MGLGIGPRSLDSSSVVRADSSERADSADRDSVWAGQVVAGKQVIVVLSLIWVVVKTMVPFSGP